MGFLQSYVTYQGYFRNNPWRDAPVYAILSLVTLAYSVLALFAELLRPPCARNASPPPAGAPEYPNPEFESDLCLDERVWQLGWMSLRESYFARRSLAAMFAGAMVGYERRHPDRPAGIRTMAITALGSCAFTIASTFAFRDGPMAWDASRVSAAIPSGVGFLGSGLIWKGMIGQAGDEIHQVHGLTTAASLWLSAAVGVCIGGGMYFVGYFTVFAAMLVLRFGPRTETTVGGDASTDDESSHHREASSSQHPPRVGEDEDVYTPLSLEPGGARNSSKLLAAGSDRICEHDERDALYERVSSSTSIGTPRRRMTKMKSKQDMPVMQSGF